MDQATTDHLGRRVVAWPRRRSVWAVGAAVLLPLLAACGGSAPTPTPVVIVVTATPAPATATSAPATAASPTRGATAVATPATVGSQPTAGTTSAGTPGTVGSQPTGAATPAGTPAAQTTRPTVAPTSGPAEQQLAVGRTNSYRGLEITADEVRSGATIGRQEAPRGKTLVGVRLRVHNPNGQTVEFSGQRMNSTIRLQWPSGANPTATTDGPFGEFARFRPQETAEGWAYFELDSAPPLAALKLALGSGNETQVVIPFTGPEQVVRSRTFENLRSTDEFRGLIWSVSGGTVRLDIPGQEANPGQEFVILKVRATNPSPAVVQMRKAPLFPQEGTEYLRLEADNGVLLQVSAALNPLPTEFPARAEQDALYAWQIPLGSQNPTLVILAPDGSEARLPIGPLPPP